MQILLDNENLIVGYAEVGSLEGGIEILPSILPDTFKVEFKRCKFKYEDGQIIYNKNFVDNEEITRLKVDNESLEEKVKRLEQRVSELENQTPTE